MTTNTEHDKNDETEDNLALVAGKVLAAMPPRMPQRLDSPSGCGWCGDEGVNDKGEAAGWRHRQADPAAWVLHVLREHLRGLLAESTVDVQFNRVGGATVVLHDAYPEDVALFRDTLGVQLSCVFEFESEGGEKYCAVDFGLNPYGREVTMVWYTTADFLRLASELATSGWPFTPTL